MVTAIKDGTESENSNEASAQIEENTYANALLVITMSNGLEKEYALNANQVEDFITWYDAKSTGSGQSYYVMNKNFNIGPFISRKDYIVFDKVLCFEIMEY